jgi:hypothetical protein
MDKFIGCIIEESLENKSILDGIKVVSTKVEQTTEKNKTPWVKQWTHHKVEINTDEAQDIAEKISEALDSKHNWYADFKNDDIHYVIYRNKVFKINRTKEEEYNEATKYGISIGIPDYQVDFADKVKKWER